MLLIRKILHDLGRIEHSGHAELLVSKLRVPFWGPHEKDTRMLGSIFGSPFLEATTVLANLGSSYRIG